MAGRPHAPCSGVADVEQRDGHGGADLVGDPVHRVGGQQQALRPRALQTLRRLDEHRGRAVPVPVVLHFAPPARSRRCAGRGGPSAGHRAGGRPLVEQSVVLRRARPAHPAQDPEKPHGTDPSGGPSGAGHAAGRHTRRPAPTSGDGPSSGMPCGRRSGRRRLSGRDRGRDRRRPRARLPSSPRRACRWSAPSTRSRRRCAARSG